MLVLNRKHGQGARISFGGIFIDVTVLAITRAGIRLGFNGAREIQVDRLEVITGQTAPEAKEAECQE